jgi:hypothetical protein
MLNYVNARAFIFGPNARISIATITQQAAM